jgi:peptide/nickel transport system permease protein
MSASSLSVAAPQEAKRPRRNPLWSNWRVRIGVALSAFFFAIAIAAPVIAPYDPLSMNPANWMVNPNREHLLGTDQFGRDVLSRLVHGSRVSLGVAVSSIVVASIIGVALGLIAGYYTGVIDNLIMRAMDLIFAFPPILLAIAVIAFLGPSFRNLVATIALLYVPRFARVVYASVHGVKHNLYVEASRSVGARDHYLITRVILPNIMAPIFVQASLALGFAILLESGLSFVGLGSQPPTPSWGQMIAGGRAVMEQAPLLVMWPALIIALNIIAFNVLGDGLRDALDPRLRGR